MDKCIVDGVTMEYHHGYVTKWGFKDNYEWTSTEYTCKHCGATSPENFPTEYRMTMTEHNATCKGDCDMCNSRKILISTGDANSSRVMSTKKWDGELNAYRAARAQGIQPNGTSMAQVQAAMNASDVMGKAYNADTEATPAAMINKDSVKSLTDAGAI